MQDLVRVTKIFTFDLAHALVNYDGPCKNIHGHTYHLHVTIVGKTSTNQTDPKLGMVLDFGELKKIVQTYILQEFDHALVLNVHAPYSSNELFNQNFEKVIRVPYQPTCENLLLDFKNKLSPYFKGSTQLFSLTLYETPTSYAQWFLKDNNI